MASSSKYNSEWKGLTLQFELTSMGGAVSIGRLIIDSGDRSEGTSEFVGERRTKLLGREVVAPSVVGGLLISYLH